MKNSSKKVIVWGIIAILKYVYSYILKYKPYVKGKSWAGH